MTAAPEGRKLLRLEVRNSETPIEKKPSWIKTRVRMGPEFTELKGLVRREGEILVKAQAHVSPEVVANGNGHSEQAVTEPAERQKVAGKAPAVSSVFSNPSARMAARWPRIPLVSVFFLTAARNCVTGPMMVLSPSIARAKNV